MAQTTHVGYIVLLVIKTGLILALLKSFALTFSWTSLLCLASLSLTFLISWSNRSDFYYFKLSQVCGLENHFKEKIGQGYLSAMTESEISQAVAELVLYDANNVLSIKNFSVIKQNTECIFAKRSKLWGSPDYDDSLSLEENTRRLIPTFYKFTLAFQDLGLDAFLIELPGQLYGDNIQVFGRAVRDVLYTMCQADVYRQKQALLKNVHKFDEYTIKNLMTFLVVDTTTWTQRCWVFQFNKITFFITTFAPFYPDSNSRYSFGSENCYILFQPEISFAVHNLPADTAETNWTHPVTVRDKIRVAFRDAGRVYHPPLLHRKPMICEIVKKVQQDDECISWWLLPQNK